MSVSTAAEAAEDDEYTMWSRPFEFGNLKVRVEEEWGLGIGGTVWEGGVLLANYLRRLTRLHGDLSCPAAFPTKQLQGKRCIEIGAGITALPGLVAASLGCFREVVLTDIEECMDALRANVSDNLGSNCTLAPAGSREALSGCRMPAASGTGAAPQEGAPGTGHAAADLRQSTDTHAAPEPVAADASGADAKTTDKGCRACTGDAHTAELSEAPYAQGCDQGDWDGQTVVQVEELDWRQDVSHLSPPFDVLLVADVVYIHKLMAPLIACLRALSDENTLILLAFYNRSETAAAVFWDLLPEWFEVTKIDEALFGIRPHSADIGLFCLRLRDKTVTNVIHDQPAEQRRT